MKTSHFLYLIFCIVALIPRTETLRASDEDEQAAEQDVLQKASLNGSREVVVALGPVMSAEVPNASTRKASELGFYVLPSKMRSLSVNLIGRNQPLVTLWQTNIPYLKDVEPELVINGLMVRDGFAAVLYTTSKTRLVLIPTESNIPGLPDPKEFDLVKSTAFSAIRGAQLSFDQELRATVHRSDGSRVWRVTSNFELEEIQGSD